MEAEPGRASGGRAPRGRVEVEAEKASGGGAAGRRVEAEPGRPRGGRALVDRSLASRPWPGRWPGGGFFGPPRALSTRDGPTTLAPRVSGRAWVERKLSVRADVLTWDKRFRVCGRIGEGLLMHREGRLRCVTRDDFCASRGTAFVRRRDGFIASRGTDFARPEERLLFTCLMSSTYYRS